VKLAVLHSHEEPADVVIADAAMPGSTERIELASAAICL
jgi:hypothetical protein